MVEDLDTFAQLGRFLIFWCFMLLSGSSILHSLLEGAGGAWRP